MSTVHSIEHSTRSVHYEKSVPREHKINLLCREYPQSVAMLWRWIQRWRLLSTASKSGVKADLCCFISSAVESLMLSWMRGRTNEIIDGKTELAWSPVDRVTKAPLQGIESQASRRR